jgi:hypothetical protein
VTPAALVPDIVSKLESDELCAPTVGIMVLRRARKETNAVVHDVVEEGRRAIVEMVELVYEIREKERESGNTLWCCVGGSSPSRRLRVLSSWYNGSMVVT